MVNSKTWMLVVIRVDGDDGCGGSCGTCSDDQECIGGQCQCLPECPADYCGDDGCGGQCVCPEGTCCAETACKPFQTEEGEPITEGQIQLIFFPDADFAGLPTTVYFEADQVVDVGGQILDQACSMKFLGTTGVTVTLYGGAGGTGEYYKYQGINGWKEIADMGSMPQDYMVCEGGCDNSFDDDLASYKWDIDDVPYACNQSD